MGIYENLFYIDQAREWEFMFQGVRRKIMGYDDNLMMVKVKFEKGAEVPSHHHPHVQSSLVESGKFEVDLGGGKQILGKGDGFFVPPDIEHKVKAIEEGIIVDTFHPAREDFLKRK